MEELRRRLHTIDSLGRAQAVLGWDQETYMPPAGADARAEHLATLAEIAHDMFISPRTGDLLAAAAEEGPASGSIEFDTVRVGRRDYERLGRIPTSLVAEMRRHASLAQPVWVRARQENDFAAFAPFIERAFALARELADHLGYSDRPYDALLAEYEPGTTSAQVDTVFAELKEELVPLVRAIGDQTPDGEDSPLRGVFGVAEQESFALEMIGAFGFDLSRGRLDRAVHPFASAFDRNDVRLTTRYDRSYLADSLFSTLHESGHGMYEQGVSAELEGTLLGTGASSALHESQSRLWENVVGRSRPVWEHFYPRLQSVFPDQLSGVSVDDFYRAVNTVKPSLVRVDADEVTYNLHIMLRYEMEQGLLDGTIPVAEAPSVWNDKMEQYLGIRPPTDTLGILQDTHWASGLIGYFPTYSLGNVLSVQFYDAATAAHPEIEAEMARGHFASLLQWLQSNVYRHGRRYEPNDLVLRATGSPMTTEHYLRYLRQKFGSLYNLEVSGRL